jgi:dethiobiotin synthetase
MNPRGCFVTGTDTGVGKTRISAGLLHWLGGAGIAAVGYKPVAAGMEWIAGRWINEDVDCLQRHGPAGIAAERIGPCQLREACAPHIAAELAGRVIERPVLLRGARELQSGAGFLVAEGAGGLIVPLGSDWDSADLAQDLGLPVVLVVGLRLGCLNHGLLTAEAVAARGLSLAGWFANTLDAGMPQLRHNVETLEHELQRRHRAPCLGVIPRLETPDAARVAAFFNAAVLRARLGLHPA